MSNFQSKFDPKIWEVVRQIKAGRIMSYGEVARAAGFPRHTRMVSKAMSRSDVPLPWFRVVRSNQSLAFEKGTEAYKKQSQLLKNEGVIIKRGKVIPLASDSDINLDELLWR
jgi:methylated-DNA-protein-cysteine methyltransferase-like protein